MPKFEIHYWLDTREIGNGYMTRACFTLYEAKRVQIVISINNKKSRDIVERLGFNLEGEMKSYFIDFVSNNISNGLLYSCCSIEKLPLLETHVFK